MSFLRTLVTAAALLVAVPLASAADLPARYTVEEKPLKAAVATTNLTFQLYSDALCTTSVYSTVIAIENVDLHARIKPFNPKNAVKKKNTVEMRATLTGVPATPSLYLKVTGTGVTPLGGACQVQASGLGAAPGESPLVVKDANGATVGLYDPSGIGLILDNGGQKVRFLYVSKLGFSASFIAQFLFTAANCVGTAQTFVDTQALVLDASVIGNTAYYNATSGGSPQTVNSALNRGGSLPFVDQTACDAQFGPGNSTHVPPDGCCQNFSFPANLAPVQSFGIGGFVPPFSIQ